MSNATRDDDASPPHTAAPEASAADVPSRRQYLALKAQHPEALLLYRLGDFYEAFDDDADRAARDARITLTSRSFGRSGRVRMAGIPHHALNHYLGRLLAAGHTVAIAEQMSEPGRGLVDRAVTRVVTPGTIAEPALLVAGENRYLASLAEVGDRCGLAWVDVSTGEFSVAEFGGADALTLVAAELVRLAPAELLIAGDRPAPVETTVRLTRLEAWHFATDRAAQTLREAFGSQALTVYGCADLPAATGAAGAILAYLRRTNALLARSIGGLRVQVPTATTRIDAATRRNLELTRGLRSGSVRGSLLSVLDRTRTAMGARALRQMIGQPLLDLAEIERRQAIVAALVAADVLRQAMSAELVRLGDLQRLIARLGQGQATARDFWHVQLALARLPALRGLLGSAATALRVEADALDSCSEVVALLTGALAEEADGTIGLRPGFWPAFDQITTDAHDTRIWLANLESGERERTGIRSLKIAYNKVFGYYIEVTRPNLNLVPSHYVRKQTVANGERYFTAELKDAEVRLLAADEAQAAEFRAALASLAEMVGSFIARLQQVAQRVAQLDALLALAEVARQQRWVRPTVDGGDRLTIVAGRHPVVEAALAGEPFIPNDCELGGGGPRLVLVTGPNMGGKSTYLRQVALIVILAQIGAFVPAEQAHIGLVDRLFSRVGAQDDLAGGASTFMVEMVETAAILHQATTRSLVILDEVGRGTSTRDGVAIAQAVLEDLHDRVGARGLFATHFLELTALAGQVGDGLRWLANAHVAALETASTVVFLHAVRPGPASQAYGIQVARLAGLPGPVADRAAALASDDAVPGSPLPTTAAEVPALVGDRPRQLPLAGLPAMEEPALSLMRALRDLDPLRLTPGEAVDWLLTQQRRLEANP